MKSLNSNQMQVIEGGRRVSRETVCGLSIGATALGIASAFFVAGPVGWAVFGIGMGAVLLGTYLACKPNSEY
ncbi:MAG: hypothetical protein OXE55_06680 [Flavobacteriaceae bacterium]|nr:hypothetical protein [Flavobacteriaceae bacterium]